MSKQNRRCIIPADTVGGATGRESIASVWKNQLCEFVQLCGYRIGQRICFRYYQSCDDTLCSDDVKSSVKSLSANKAGGLDNLFAEHLL